MELTVNGRRVFAATGGRLFDRAHPAVVFVHGAGCDHTVWQLQSRWFAWHGYAVLAVDLPGHGRSEGPGLQSIGDMRSWIGDLLDAAELEGADLIGHSMGGAIAVEAAAALPKRVTRLALLGTAASIPVHKDLLAAARDEPERAYRIMTGWAHGTEAKIGGHPAPGLWMSGGTLALLARNAPGILYSDLAACAEWHTGTEAAAKVQCPALIVVAANDIMVPAKSGRILAELVRDSRTVTIERCGHMLPVEAPDQTLNALIAFFGRADA
jgi:pimeloyl-ACP methyl ester carboxylesterase